MLIVNIALQQNNFLLEVMWYLSLVLKKYFILYKQNYH